MTPPETRYARSGDVRIAYQIVGQGPLDVVFVPGFISNLDVQWEDPGFSHLLRRLSSFSRLILFDKRGTGLSDRVDTHHLPTLETRMDDVRAVMDAAGSGRAALLGASEGGPMAILFAATYPQRTRALVLYGAYAHFHTFVMQREAMDDFVRGIERDWGNGASVTRFAPELGREESFRAWWGRYERLSASPTAAIALARMNAAIDVRPVLRSIRVPTLIVHRSDDARVKVAGGRYLAGKIPGAQFVEVPGRDHPLWTGDIDRVVDEIEEFLTGTRPAPAIDRVLATLLVARLVSPGRMAARIGDRHWRAKVEQFHAHANDAIARHSGQPVAFGADDVSARFDGPARAVRCARALQEAASVLGLPLACGAHTGEIELTETGIAGLALHVAAHIAARAGDGEILVSGMLADLVAGSDLHFTEYGIAPMDGFDNGLRLLALAGLRETQPAAMPGYAAARAAATDELATLSGREREVLGLVAEGLSNAMIAQRLRLSEHTVKRHVANILVKLDLPTRAAAAALAGRARAT
jgi:pimeloyl-ACP methyl ester carboxylesterase/DNA-binding CsgD family transcriptional regulator